VIGNYTTNFLYKAYFLNRILLALLVIIWQLTRQNCILKQSQGQSYVNSEGHYSEVIVKSS